MEAALGMLSLVAVTLLVAAGVAACCLQIRCLDAAREAARLASRGDAAAAATAGGLVPTGATLEIRRQGGFVLARVSSRAPMLPGIVVAADAVAAAEPGL